MNAMMSKKKLILIIVAMLLIFNIGFVVLYFFVLSPAPSQSPDPAPEPAEVPEPAPETQELSSEYYSTLFNSGDAIEICSIEVRSRNSNLIQLTVNERSTRFKPAENMYLVKMNTQVGTPLLYDEKSHTCEIDPNTQGVAFYQEITRRKAVRPQ